ncbi:MAG: NAD-dependent epimerase/dehydratase family protein [Candidatus Altiarchaeales archaeon]|nr:NAD-dependent epimerase/dehydratase family protein [Candidatus Altiarchaeales archaeon]
MRILITGGAGFLGNELVARLAKNRSNEIFILDSFLHGSSMVRNLPKRKNVHNAVVGNVRNYYDIFRVIDRDKPDVVVHLAAHITRPESVDNFRACAETNYVGMANVLDACSVVKKKPSRIVFASCESAKKPVSHYGISKRACEDLLHLIAPLMGIDPVSLRLSEIYGLSKSHTSTSMVNFLVDTMLLGQDIALFNVNKERDFVHVSDAARAFELAIKYEGEEPLGRVDIGTGEGVAIKDLANQIKTTTKYQGDLVFRDWDLVRVVSSVADPSRAKDLLDFECETSFQEELGKMVKKRRKALK